MFLEKKAYYKRFKNVIQILLASTEPTSIQAREKSILALAVKLKDKKIQIDSEIIKKEYTKYYWINDYCLNFNNTEKLDHFIGEIKKESLINPQKQLNDLRQAANDIKRNKTKLIRQYKFGKRLILLSEQASVLPHIRFLRLETILAGSYILKDNLLKIISQKLALKDITQAYFWEISEALATGKIDKNKIQKRKQDYNFVVIGNFIKELNSEEANILKQKI
jgi:hypothetical protein